MNEEQVIEIPESDLTQPAQPAVASIESKKKRPKKIILFVGVFMGTLVLALAILAVYFYLFPAKKDPIKVLDNMLSKIPEIQLAEYTITAGFSSKPREAGAVSWEVAVPEFGEQKKAIKRDNERLQDLSSLQSELLRYHSDNKIYPPTLDDIPNREYGSNNFRHDPGSGQLYGYRQESGGTNFVLHVTLESSTAISLYQERYEEIHETSATIRQEKTIEASADSKSVYISTSYADVSPYPISLDFSEYYQYLPVEVDAEFNVTAQHDLEQVESADAAVRGSGRVDLGGTSFSGAAELRKIADDFFAHIEQAPSLGFFDLAAVKNKWIHVPLNQLLSYYGYGDEDTFQEKSASVLKQYKILLDLLKEHDMIRAEAELPMEEVAGQKSYHYQIKLDRNKLPTFYKSLTDKMESEFEDDAIIEFKESTLTYLESAEFEAFYSALDRNVVLDLWIDTKSFWPRRLTYTMQLIPPTEIEKQKDIQYELTLAVELDKFNQEIVVERPTETISLDEAQVLLTGQTLSQVKLGRQASQVRSVRDGLRAYYARAGVYPDNLEGLTKKVSEVPSNPPAKEDGYYASYYLERLEEKDSPFLRALPLDVFSDRVYGYSSSGSNYELVYMVELGEPSAISISDYVYESNLRTYVEGLNTATKDETSREGAEPGREIPSTPVATSGPGAAANSARIKSNLGQMRTLAEVYYDSNNSSYVSFDTCVATPSAFACKNQDLADSTGKLTADLATAIGTKALTVNTAKTAFCMSHPLPDGEQTCVDSTGQFQTSITASCGATATVCSK